MSYLTPEEWRAAIERFRYSGDQPLSYREVSKSHLSRTVKDGGLKFGGAAYLYEASADELIRQDVLKWVLKRRADAAIAANTAAEVEAAATIGRAAPHAGT